MIILSYYFVVLWYWFVLFCFVLFLSQIGFEVTLLPTHVVTYSCYLYALKKEGFSGGDIVLLQHAVRSGFLHLHCIH